MAISPGRNMMLYLNCDILKFEPLDAKHKISFSALCERWQDSDVPRLGWIGARHLAPLPSWHCSLAHVMCYGMCYSTCWYVGVVWRRAWTRNPSWSLELLWLLVCTLAEALTLAWAWFVGWRTDPTHTHRAMRRRTVWKHVQTCATANCNVCTCHLCDFL